MRLKPCDLPGRYVSRNNDGRSPYGWRTNRRAARLIRRHGGRIMRYRDLPVEARYAVAHYMAVDGTAWEYPRSLNAVAADAWMTRFKRANRFFVNRYGDERFGYVEVPTEELVRAVWEYHHPEDDFRQEFSTFEEYHRSYQEQSHLAAGGHGKSVWPVILNCCENDDDAGLLQDGWHRFHAYVAVGVKTVPCIWYPRRPWAERLSSDGAAADRWAISPRSHLHERETWCASSGSN